MECRITSTRRRAGFTIPEVLIASTLALVIGIAIAAFTVFSTRTFVAMGNYTDMNEQSRLALDKMSKDIRQARELTSYSPTNLNFLDVNTNSLQFVYNGTARELQRISGGQTTVLLTNCDSLQFWAYQHTLISNTFLCYNAATTNSARVITVSWHCSRNILGKAMSESAEGSEIVMRNH